MAHPRLHARLNIPAPIYVSPRTATPALPPSRLNDRVSWRLIRAVTHRPGRHLAATHQRNGPHHRRAGRHARRARLSRVVVRRPLRDRRGQSERVQRRDPVGPALRDRPGLPGQGASRRAVGTARGAAGHRARAERGGEARRRSPGGRSHRPGPAGPRRGGQARRGAPEPADRAAAGLAQGAHRGEWPGVRAEVRQPPARRARQGVRADRAGPAHHAQLADPAAGLRRQPDRARPHHDAGAHRLRRLRRPGARSGRRFDGQPLGASRGRRVRVSRRSRCR